MAPTANTARETLLKRRYSGRAAGRRPRVSLAVARAADSGARLPGNRGTGGGGRLPSIRPSRTALDGRPIDRTSRAPMRGERCPRWVARSATRAATPSLSHAALRAVPRWPVQLQYPSGTVHRSHTARRSLARCIHCNEHKRLLNNIRRCSNAIIGAKRKQFSDPDEFDWDTPVPIVLSVRILYAQYIRCWTYCTDTSSGTCKTGFQGFLIVSTRTRYFLHFYIPWHDPNPSSYRILHLRVYYFSFVENDTKLYVARTIEIIETRKIRYVSILR